MKSQLYSTLGLYNRFASGGTASDPAQMPTAPISSAPVNNSQITSGAPMPLAAGGIYNSFQATAPINNFSATDPAAAGTLSQANAQAAGGSGPASGTLAQESALSQSLQAAASGQGPNPALAQLKQATSANINNAAGMAASSRGINPALAARMAVDSAGQANQSSAGQAATMEAQQQIAARQQLSQVYGQIAQQQNAQQATGVNALGTAGGLNLNAQSLNQKTQSENAAMNLGAQQLMAGVDAQNATTNMNLVGGIMNGIGSAGSAGAQMMGGSGGGGGMGAMAAMMAKGGTVPDSQQEPLYSYLDAVHGYDDGGSVEGADFTEGGGSNGSDAFSGSQAGGSMTQTDNPASDVAKSPPKDDVTGLQAFGQSLMSQNTTNAFEQATSKNVLGSLAHGGSIHAHGSHKTVPAMVSPGEKVLPPGTTPDKAKALSGAAPRIPGSASVKGNSPKNDTVHARLQVGSIVLPRTVVNAKNPGKAASSFVASVMKRQGSQKYAAGGKVAKGASPETNTSEPTDYSKGGHVGAPASARGVGRDETRRRIKSSSKPKHAEED